MEKTELKGTKIVAQVKRDHLTMKVDKEEFAMALKTWRIRNNLTQEQAGKRWGLSRWTIMRVEKAEGISWVTAYKCFAKLSEELRKEVSNG